jgi:hypothetical protein
MRRDIRIATIVVVAGLTLVAIGHTVLWLIGVR